MHIIVRIYCLSVFCTIWDLKILTCQKYQEGFAMSGKVPNSTPSLQAYSAISTSSILYLCNAISTMEKGLAMTEKPRVAQVALRLDREAL